MVFFSRGGTVPTQTTIHFLEAIARVILGANHELFPASPQGLGGNI
jgi:hypothetical protein